MLSLVFAVAALALFGLSYFLVRKTSAYSRTGGDAYVRRQKRKMIGITLLFPATLLTVLAVGIFLGSIPESLPPPEAIASEPYVPPVLPKPSENDPLASREPPMKFSTDSAAARRRASDDIPSLSVQALSSPPATTPASALASPVASQFASAFASPPSAAPDRPPGLTPPAAPEPEAPNLTADEKFNDELGKLKAILKADPNNAKVYGDLGNLYANRRAWAEAEASYKKSLALDNTISNVKYNVAQMQFVQKKYDAARAGFAALEHDAELGDLALYQTFLCDLYGGHQDVAAKELDAFNQAGENASYYFANAAWSLYQKKPDDAQGWLASAERIYAPQKAALYTADLFQLGYLPIPSAP